MNEHRSENIVFLSHIPCVFSIQEPGEVTSIHSSRKIYFILCISDIQKKDPLKDMTHHCSPLFIVFFFFLFQLVNSHSKVKREVMGHSALPTIQAYTQGILSATIFLRAKKKNECRLHLRPLKSMEYPREYPLFCILSSPIVYLDSTER